MNHTQRRHIYWWICTKDHNLENGRIATWTGIYSISNGQLQAKSLHHTHISQKHIHHVCLKRLFSSWAFLFFTAVSLQPGMHLHTCFQHCEYACARLECLFSHVCTSAGLCVFAVLYVLVCLCVTRLREPRHLTRGQWGLAAICSALRESAGHPELLGSNR